MLFEVFFVPLQPICTIMAEIDEINSPSVEYGEENIIHLDDMEHIRRRPGMCIGKWGDGSRADNGL